MDKIFDLPEPMPTAPAAGTPSPSAVVHAAAPDQLNSLDHVRVCSTPSELSAIHSSSVNLAVWERSVPPAIESGLDGLVPEDLPQFTASLKKSRVRSQLRRSLTAAPTLPDEIEAFLLHDCNRLVEIFFSLTQAAEVLAKLSVIGDDACRYFHHDARSVRLLCTYRGPGTEWLPNAFVDRTAVGSGNNARICKDDRQIRRLARFAVGLLKGRSYPRNLGNGLIHRSPPIATKRETRLLLCLDEAD